MGPGEKCGIVSVYGNEPDVARLVYEVRKRLGGQLAEEVNINADCVITVPDSSAPAGIGYSQKSGISLEQALVKNLKHIVRV